MRVLKLVLERREALETMTRVLCGFGRRSGAQRVAFRMQGGLTQGYATLVEMGARVRWTDLRMTLAGYPEPPQLVGLALSNWEI
jgi:hypothetical protein